MIYNCTMTNDLALPEEVNEALGEVADFDLEVDIRQCISVMEFRVSAGCSIKAACEELGYDYRRTLRLMNSDVMKNYLQQANGAEKGLIQMQILQRMGKVVLNMLDVASGEKVIKGVNPVAAARFAKDYLDDLEETIDDDEEEDANFNLNVFIPERSPIQYKNAAPVLEGQVTVIEEGD